MAPRTKFLPFAEWLPDQAKIFNPGSPSVNNVFPIQQGYGPVPSVEAASTTGGPTAPTGFFSAISQARNPSLFAGDATKLYKENTGTGVFDDVSRTVGGVYAGGTNRWRNIQFDDTVYAVNGIDDMQKFELDVDTDFADAATDVAGIGGQFIAMVQDFLVLGRAKDDAVGIVPNRVRWSGIRQPLSWTVDPQTLSDFQDIQDLGEVRGLTGGSYMTVLMEKGVVRGDFIGPPLVFRFIDVEGSLGCLTAASVVRLLGRTFYLSEEGFRVFDGVSTEAPGDEKVDRTFFNLLKPEKLDDISPFVVREEHLVGWLFTSNDTPDDKPDKAIVYNYQLGKWSIFDAPVDIIGQVTSSGDKMDALDTMYPLLDDMPGTLDSRIYQGDGVFLGGLRGGILQVFGGASQPATIETVEGQIVQNQRALLTRGDPFVEGDMATVTLDVVSRDVPNGARAVATGFGYNSDGYIPLRNEARYHAIRAQISGVWDHATGVSVEAIPTGTR